MNDILISIIVPAYNLERYLEKTVNSILEQTHRNIEVILVNDGSEDNTWNVIEKLAEKDVRVIPINKENGGVTSARLEGIRAAKGEYIGFVDGDDIIEPDMYSRLLKNALKHGASISHCGYKKVSGKSEKLFYGTGVKLIQNREDALASLIEGKIVEPALVTKLFKRDLTDRFLDADLVDRTIRHNEDLLMNYYLFKYAENAVYEDFCPYHYIVRAGSATQRSVSKELIYDPSHVRELILEDLESNGLREGNALYDVVRTSALRLYISAYTMLLRDDAVKLKDHKKVFRDKIIKNRKYIKFLNKGGRLHAWAIVFAPHLCKPVFKKLKII